jgi:hypothetical protein
MCYSRAMTRRWRVVLTEGHEKDFFCGVNFLPSGARPGYP